MAMAVSLDGSVALSVSADHLVGRYDLDVRDDDPSGTARNAPLVHLLTTPTYSQIRSTPQGQCIERSTQVTVR